MNPNNQSKIIYFRTILKDKSKSDIEREVARKELLEILGSGDNGRTNAREKGNVVSSMQEENNISSRCR